MLKKELLQIITSGENSGVEFKRDDVRPEQWSSSRGKVTETPGAIRPLRNNKRATSVRVFQLLGLNAAVLEHVWKYAALIQLRHLLLVSRLPPGLRAWC